MAEINLSQLQNDPSSFLSLRPDDPVLRKLETYRLWKAGVSVTEIARAFGVARQSLYEMWKQFEADGVNALVNKNWGAEPRKLTSAVESAIIRAKAIDPYRSDADLAEEFGVGRVSVYRLLKEHGIQDLHKIIDRRTE